MTVSQYVLLGRTPHLGYLGREGSRDRDLVDETLDRWTRCGCATASSGT